MAMTLEEAYHLEDVATKERERCAQEWDEMQKLVEAAQRKANEARIAYDRACTNEKQAKQRVAHILFPNG